jgi:hypothetical protein
MLKVVSEPRVIPRNHGRLDAHVTQAGKAFLDAALDDVLELDDPKHLAGVGYDQRRASLFGDSLDDVGHGLRKGSPLS